MIHRLELLRTVESERTHDLPADGLVLTKIKLVALLHRVKVMR